MKKARYLLLIIGFLFLYNGLKAIPKTDTVYFQNGDKLTCEFKELMNSLLKVKTSDAGTISIKWEKIDSLYIKQFLSITLEDGEIIVGSIKPSGEPGFDMLVGHFGLRKVPHLSIVMIHPYRKRALDRFSGTIGSGFSYTKANKLGRFEINSDITYYTKNTITYANYDANFTYQEDEETAKRQNASINFVRLLKNRFNYNLLLSYDQNSELGLNSRINLGIGGGNFLINNYHSRALVGLGVQINREYSIDSVANSAEGMIKMNYQFFKHSFPKVDFLVEGNFFPNLIDFNRVRATVDSKLRWELFDNFYLKYTLYYTFDSRPLDVNASKSDWGLTLGFDFTFSN